MKKLMSLAMAIVLFSFVACTKNNDQAAPATGGDAEVAEGTASPAGAPEEMKEKDAKEAHSDGAADHNHAE